MQRILAREGEPITADAETAQAIRRRLVALKDELDPRLGFLAGGEADPTVQNLIGSVQITPGLVLDVAPKTKPGQGWARAAFDLLVDERVSFDALTDDAEISPRAVLPNAFAALYADQLDKALRRDGPLSVMVQSRVASPRLSGRLDVTRWLANGVTRPQVFPQHRTELAVDNAFTAAMAWVAEALAVRSSDPRLKSRLRQLVGYLRPGLPTHVTIDPGVGLRDIPPQWRAYGPAWVTVRAVLARISPLQRSGILEGLGLAIEPWPLLETLLHRSVRAAAEQAGTEGHELVAHPQTSHRLLTPDEADEPTGLSRVHLPRTVEPDATLKQGEQVLATFEAKYSVPTHVGMRSHVFQALTQAAALDAPLAVLVYPEPSEAISWSTHRFGGKPRRLVAIGLDMYSYRRGAGDRERGDLLLDLVRPEVLAAAEAATT